MIIFSFNCLDSLCILSLPLFFNRKWITVGGIRSTGVSGSLGLSNRVLNMVVEDLQLEPSSGVNCSVSTPNWHFTDRGTAVINGKEVVVTHPIAFYGNKRTSSKI